MADAWQSAWVEVLPDFKNFRRNANNELGDILGSAGDSGGTAAGNRFGTSFTKLVGGSAFGNLIANAVSGVTRLVGDGISAGLQFAFDGITAASDLSETKSAVQQVFGSASDDIAAFAKTANKRLGQTQQQALAAAQTFGVFGQSAGLQGSDLASFSNNLTGLATDFASFYNTSPQDAIEAIGAGLRGESEPLRKYGVLLDDATLKAEAMKLGIFDGTGTLTQQQRVLAANAAIFEQSGVAQGDFGRTAGGLANQQRILGASFEEAQTKLGTALLPGMLSFATFANETLIPALDDLIQQVGPVLGDAFEKAGPAFADFLNKVGPYLPDLITLGTEALPKIFDAIAGGVGFVRDFAGGLKNIFDAVKIVSDFLNGDISFQTFTTRLHDLARGFSDPVRALTDFGITVGIILHDAVAKVSDFARSTGARVGEAIGFFVGLPGQISAVFAGAGTWLVRSGQALIQGFIDGIRGMIGRVGQAVGGVMDFVKGFFPHSPAKRGPFSGSGWTRLRESGGALMDQFSAGAAERSLAFMPNVAGVGAAVSRSVNLAVASSLPTSGGMSVTQYIELRDEDPTVVARKFAREWAVAAAGAL